MSATTDPLPLHSPDLSGQALGLPGRAQGFGFMVDFGILKPGV